MISIKFSNKILNYFWNYYSVTELGVEHLIAYYRIVWQLLYLIWILTY